MSTDVYAIFEDPYGNPIAGATVSVSLDRPDATADEYVVPAYQEFTTDVATPALDSILLVYDDPLVSFQLDSDGVFSTVYVADVDGRDSHWLVASSFQQGTTGRGKGCQGQQTRCNLATGELTHKCYCARVGEKKFGSRWCKTAGIRSWSPALRGARLGESE